MTPAGTSNQLNVQNKWEKNKNKKLCFLLFVFCVWWPGIIKINVSVQFVCVCVFIKLHITTQSGPVILVILCHSVCVCVCVFIKLHITAQSGPVILVILCHSH